MSQFRNKEMRFDLDPATGMVLRVEMQVAFSGDLTDDRDQGTHRVDTVKPLVITGDQLSAAYKTALEDVANDFLVQYRTSKAK